MSKIFFSISLLFYFLSTSLLFGAGENSKTIYRWTGKYGHEWSTGANWVDNVGVEHSNPPALYSSGTFGTKWNYAVVIIENTANTPMLSQDIKLTSLILKDGAKLEVSGSVNIEITHEFDYSDDSNYLNYPDWEKVENYGAILIGTSSSMIVQKYFDNYSSGSVTSNGGFIVNNIINNFGSVFVPPNGNVDFYNELNNKNTGVFDIESNAKVDVTGDLNNEGNFTINSDAAGTGSLISNSSITNTGIFNVERYINTIWNGDEADRWHLVSSPVDSEVSDVYLSHYLHSFDEASNSYSEITSKSHNLTPGEGFATLFTTNGSNPLVFNTTPNSVEIKIPITTVAGTPSENDSWNLLGNPFTSSIDLDEVWTTNSSLIEQYFYILENDVWKIYPTPDSGTQYRYIPQGQGFFVHSIVNDDFIFNVGQQSHENSTSFSKKSSQNNSTLGFTIIAKSGADIDKAYYVLNDEASDEFNRGLDAYKFLSWSNHPNIFFRVDNKNIAISNKPESKSAELGFLMYQNTSNIAISIDNLDGFDSVFLEDRKENIITDITSSSYEFDYNTDDTEDRFVLHFKKNSLGDVNIDKDNIEIYSFKNNIRINSPDMLDEATCNIYSLSGQLVEKHAFSNFISKTFTTNLSEGVYVIELITSGVITKKKILISRK